VRSLGFVVRYDPDVRTVLIGLALLAAGGTRDASSRPARSPKEMDMLERDEPVEPCGTAKKWKAIETCLAKQGTPTVKYETDGMKVVELSFRAPATSTRLVLYTGREGGWVRGSLFAMTSPNNVLLGMTSFASPLGAGVRIDMGQTMQTVISFNEGSTRGVLRRVTTTVCVPTAWQCRAVLTSCDAYAHGRLVWTFHGSVVWHPSLGLRLQGDPTRAGGICTPPRQMLDSEEAD
jgi:hypothetical protein